MLFFAVIICAGLILLVCFLVIWGRQLWVEGKLLTVEVLYMTRQHTLSFVHLALVAREQLVKSTDHLVHLPYPRLPGKGLRC